MELKLAADSFNNGLRDAQKEAKEFEKNLKPTLSATKDLGIAMAAVGTAVVGAFTAMTKSAVDYGDKLNDARQRTGRTVEELAKLGFAAEQSGTSFEDLSRGLAFLAKNTKATTQDLNVIADTFAKMEDGPQKAKLAFDLFGKSGQALIPLLNEGSAGIRRLGDDAQRAGLVISQDFASASDQFNDTLNQVKASVMGVSVGVAQALLPTLQSAASTVADLSAKFAAFAKENPALVQATGALGVSLLTVGSSLAALAVVIPKVQNAYYGLSAAVAGPAGLVVAIGAAVIAIGAIVYASKQWYDAEENLKKQNQELATSEERAAEALKKHGIQIRLDQIPLERRAEAIAKLGQRLVEVKETTGPLIDATELARRNAESHALAVQKQAEALEKSRKAADDLRASVMKIQTPLGDWADAVHEYGDEWERFRKTLVNVPSTLNIFEDDFRNVTELMREAVGDVDELNTSLGGLNQNVRDVLIKDPGVQIAGGINKATEATKRLDDTFNDVKHTATNVFRDILRDGELSFSKLGGIVKGIFETIASEVLGSITAKLITPLVSKIEGALSSLLGKIPGLGGVFGGGASAASGAVTSGGGSASSGLSGALNSTGIVGGLISGGIAAAGSLLGSARLEGTMNAVEFNTRATMIQLRDAMDLILQPMKARLEDILAELYNHKYIPDLLETIANRVIAVPSGGSSTGTGTSNSFSINVYQNPGEDGFSFATRVADMLNRYVEHSGGRLIASGLKA